MALLETSSSNFSNHFLGQHRAMSSQKTVLFSVIRGPLVICSSISDGSHSSSTLSSSSVVYSLRNCFSRVRWGRFWQMHGNSTAPTRKDINPALILLTQLCSSSFAIPIASDSQAQHATGDHFLVNFYSVPHSPHPLSPDDYFLQHFFEASIGEDFLQGHDVIE